MSELCKHLPIEIVEQYRRGAYVRYAINSMEDIALHAAARVKLLLIKVAVAMRVKVMLRGWLLFRKLESIVIMYLISIQHGSTYG